MTTTTIQMWEQRIRDTSCDNEDFVMAIVFNKECDDVLSYLLGVDIKLPPFPKPDDDWSEPQLILKYENGVYRLVLETYQNGGYNVVFDNMTTIADAAILFRSFAGRFWIVNVNGNSIVDAWGNLMDDEDYSDDDIENTFRAANEVTEDMPAMMEDDDE